MIIAEVTAREDGTLYVVSEDGRSGSVDIRPYFESEAFLPLKDWDEFARVRNGGYFVEWKCGADLSADTIEARWQENRVQNTQQEPTQPKKPVESGSTAVR